MTSLAPGGYAYVDPDDTLVDYPIASQALAESVSDALGFGPSWTGNLPANPVAGQRALMWTGQSMWDFAYDAGGSWWFVGGAPLFAHDVPAIALPQPWTNYPPVLTIPMAGAYQVEWGMEWYDAVAPSPAVWYASSIMGPGIGLDVVTQMAVQPEGASANTVQTASTGRLIVFSAAGDVWTVHQHNHQICCRSRWLRITPVYLTP